MLFRIDANRKYEPLRMLNLLTILSVRLLARVPTVLAVPVLELELVFERTLTVLLKHRYRIGYCRNTIVKNKYLTGDLFKASPSAIRLERDRKRRRFRIIVVFSCRYHSGKVTIISLKQSTLLTSPLLTPSDDDRHHE